MIIARNISKRTAQLINTTRRAHATSTMGAIANRQGSHQYENSDSIPDKERSFSTAMASSGADESFALPTQMATSYNSAEVPLAFGAELELLQAVMAVKNEHDFDKILLVVSHGEAAIHEEEDSRSDAEAGVLSLTAKGIGQALSTSGETAAFCNNDTNLIPELFVISPLRSAAEAALISFPYYSPHSIHNTKWVCHGGAYDGDLITPVEHIERAFPGIDCTHAHDKSDLLSWLKSREEKVIAVSSTGSWVNSFCSTFGSNNSMKPLRAVGIKYMH